MLAIAVSVRRGSQTFLRNLFCLDFTDGTSDRSKLLVIVATSNGEYGRLFCNKTFCQKILDFSPDSGFFRNFFISPWSLDHSWDIMFYKVVYIFNSQEYALCSNTTHNVEIYILISYWLCVGALYLKKPTMKLRKF